MGESFASKSLNGHHVRAAWRSAPCSALVFIVLYAAVTGPFAHALVWISPGSSQVPYATGDLADYVPGELIIEVNEQSKETLQRFLNSWNAKIVGELPEIQAYLVRFEGPSVSTMLSQKEAYTGFAYWEPNYYVTAALTPNDPLWASQWAPHKVRADLAWDIELGKRSVIVAVVDTGIDYHHEDLAGNYLPSGYDWVNHDNDPMDDSITGHGTHVAGIIGAATNNGLGVAGLSQVSIMAEKALNNVDQGTIFNVAQGVVDATEKGARITSNSYGTYGFSATLRNAFEYAWLHGVLSFAAAGNDNTDQPFYPAAFGEFVVAVAGTDESDTKWSLSNYGDWIELSAPAVGVVSTLPGNGYGEMTGTSQASAVASGAAALVWSHCQTMSAEQVRRRLQESAVDLGDAGRDPYFGYGRVDLFSALSAPCPIPVGGTILAQGRTENLVFELLVAIVMPCLGLLAVTLIYGRSYRRPGKSLRC